MVFKYVKGTFHTHTQKKKKKREKKGEKNLRKIIQRKA